MAKWQNDDMLDAALNYVKTNCDEMILCSAQPTTYAEATVTYDIADVAMTSGDFTGPIHGDDSGRKITVNTQVAVNVDTTGDGNHIALVGTIDAVNTLIYVIPTNTITVIAGTVTFPAWDIEVRDSS